MPVSMFLLGRGVHSPLIMHSRLNCVIDHVPSHASPCSLEVNLAGRATHRRHRRARERGAVGGTPPSSSSQLNRRRRAAVRRSSDQNFAASSSSLCTHRKLFGRDARLFLGARTPPMDRVAFEGPKLKFPSVSCACGCRGDTPRAVAGDIAAAAHAFLTSSCACVFRDLPPPSVAFELVHGPSTAFRGSQVRVLKTSTDGASCPRLIGGQVRRSSSVFIGRIFKTLSPHGQPGVLRRANLRLQFSRQQIAARFAV